MSGTVFKVRRITRGCCGMTCGEVYDAVGGLDGYLRVQLPDGSWTDEHFAPGHFEAVEALENCAGGDLASDEGIYKAEVAHKALAEIAKEGER